MSLQANHIATCWSFLYTADQMGTTPPECLIEVKINGGPSKGVASINTDNDMWGRQWCTLERPGIWAVEFERDFCMNCAMFQHAYTTPIPVGDLTECRNHEPFLCNADVTIPLKHERDDVGYLLAMTPITILRMTGDLNQIATDIRPYQLPYTAAVLP